MGVHEERGRGVLWIGGILACSLRVLPKRNSSVEEMIGVNPGKSGAVNQGIRNNLHSDAY
jgi:hypothetical protein